ncbi:FAD-dependent oxidoreductase [Ramlibacter sp. USB13]|uniref:FAD-dependent oxidoreductase n=1 Tax=Ramlibacter cellulosilyticus TaxID=2764187 RepID=A0A923MX72_9BURK|nr:FAD-dependent oxidoreductase [Ramlibacter cellulosilyticus]MBC5785794.1 FAD-dependent oxidoreductase [Ramlibacter cellulosilyticus]
MTPSPEFDAVVVGAGVAGLFCAASLADAGVKVAVLEARADAGGRARSWHDATMGLEVDIGPHVLSSEHRQFVRMLRRLGTADQVQWQREPQVTLLDAGELLAVRNVRWTPPLHGLPNLPVALRRIGWRDAVSHWRVAWHAARANEESLRALDGIAALHWLRSLGVTTRAIDWFWRSALLALLNVPLEHCSAAAAMRVFRLMLGRSGYHFGFPTTGLSRLYVPACVGLVRERGSAFFTRSAVRNLEIENDRVAGVRLRDGKVLRAPWCVLALPPWNLAPLLARTRSARLAGLAEAASRFLGAPYTSTVLALDRRVGELRFRARVWNPADFNTDFYDLANIRPELAGGGSVIACNAIGPHARLAWSDREVVARTMAELADCTPAARDARVLRACVHRIRAAIPQPRPGTETLRPPTRTGLQGLLLAGDWIATAVPCSMESAARSAALAAGAILGRELVLPPPESYGFVGLLRKRA